MISNWRIYRRSVIFTYKEFAINSIYQASKYHIDMYYKRLSVRNIFYYDLLQKEIYFVFNNLRE